MNQSTLYYVHDPMCSWCWGYQPVWQQLQQMLAQQWPTQLTIRYLVGGLAADSDQPMPLEQQRVIASYWHKIEQELKTPFNYDFWRENIPRRSTYPACRAVIAARNQNAERTMISAIQQAYYLRALNPSDNSILLQLAKELHLDHDQFKADMESDQLNQQLLDEIHQVRMIGGNSFPSLFLERQGEITELPIDYHHAEPTKQIIECLLR
ncbi:DsbA family protein [Vibrio renipiscarius]|uniref:DsbA family protein n=1 Tax=Vibrio renipiscarius TaxID=1461322 RepID=UPI00354EB444